MLTVKLTRRTFVCVHRSGFYFRVAGVGISFDFDMPVLFSERNGFRKIRRIGRLSMEVL
ncbi:hypothetical protein [Burkholderia cepacia]|uniref:hypothetical protein n=1 Tax=Burkholderia cepacia TaxID=292 RepID=UPI001F43B5AD|nr:hypothetical protein [Burkholderia cepacia]UIY60058.1 hypothetical protein LZ568_18655 [Burkholderia cepacia]